MAPKTLLESIAAQTETTAFVRDDDGAIKRWGDMTPEEQQAVKAGHPKPKKEILIRGWNAQ